MRLLHTSDWHLGRSFHGTPLLPQQRAVLGSLVELVRAEGIDVVLVAGDLYDRQLPPVDAVELLSETLGALREAGARVVGIAGNHDSATRVGFAEQLLSRSGVSLRGDVRRLAQPVVVPANDGGPDLAVAAVPYLEPESARHHLGAPDARTHDTVLRVALDTVRTGLERAAHGSGRLRSVVMAHAFVAGGEPCDSERPLTVGGAGRVGAQRFAGFDYVALGHLHGAQVLGDGSIRYSGSPLAYSFSEKDQRKGAWLVDMAPDGAAAAVFVELPAPRPLVALRGQLDHLLRSREVAAAEGAWVQATLTDQVLPREAMARLRARFPHAVSLHHDPPVAAGAGDGSYRDRVHDVDDLALLRGFLTHVTGAVPDAASCRELEDAVATVRRAEGAA